MNTPSAPQAELDEALATSLNVAAHVASTVVLSGARQFDRFCVTQPQGGGGCIVSLEQLCHDATSAQASWLYDPATAQVSLLRTGAQRLSDTRLPTQPGRPEGLPLAEVLAAFYALPAPPEGGRWLLLVDAGLMFEYPSNPRAEDFMLLRLLERYSRTAPRSHLLLLRVPQTANLPPGLLQQPQVRTVHLLPPSRDVRYAYAHLRGQALAERCGSGRESVAHVISGATEDWNLDQVDRLLQAADKAQARTLVEVEELARAIRIGTSKSPWVGQQIRQAVAGAQTTLQQRVRGQPQAIEAVVTALKKAVTGLSGAHEGRNTATPRAVFFFAGPTGTGKTELAKALAQLVFGQETIVRFDCAEFRQDHAVSRLIGAPPGYVGYEKGGELTEAVRAKPNSVILFDEIEKAHPRLLDIFLSILSDGRLSNGSGETADFSQTIIIMTSNMGMYHEESDGMGGVIRRPRFEYSTPFARIQEEVRQAIRHEFVSTLGRPEILGRLGGAQSIICFDYLRDLTRVTQKFVSNVQEKCLRLHGVTLTVDDALVQTLVEQVKSQPDALVLGGRGLATELDRLLISPLCLYLFDARPVPQRLHARWRADTTVFETP